MMVRNKNISENVPKKLYFVQSWMTKSRQTLINGPMKNGQNWTQMTTFKVKISITDMSWWLCFSGVAPEPVQDTPEVAAAKADFAAKFEEVANRQKRESDPMLGFGYGYGYNSPWLLNRRYQSVVHNGLYAYNRLGYYGYGYGRYYYWMQYFTTTKKTLQSFMPFYSFLIFKWWTLDGTIFCK